MIIVAAMLEGATLASVELCFVVGLNSGSNHRAPWLESVMAGCFSWLLVALLVLSALRARAGAER